MTIIDGAISNYAFYNCRSLTSVTIGNGVTSIGLYAFRYCESLTSIIIPKNVTMVWNRAFEYCTSLSKIYCEVTSKPLDWAQYWNASSDVYPDQYHSVVWDYKNK